MAEENNQEDVLEEPGTAEVETEDITTKVPVRYAEEAVLGIFMQDDDSAAYIAQSGLREDHFQKRRNKLLYPVILNARHKMGTCNIDFLVDECEKTVLPSGETLLNFIGGVPALTEMLQTPIGTDIKTTEGYIKIVFEQWRLAKIKDAARILTNLNGFDEHKIIDKVSALQNIVSDQSLNKFGLVNAAELFPNAILRYNDRFKHPEKYVPIRTGFGWVDRYRAVAKKRTCIVAARTNIGKSTFVGNMINVMIDDNRNTLLFTPEMDKEEYIDRLLCSNTGVSIDAWKRAIKLEQVDLDKILARSHDVATSHPYGISIEDKGSQTAGYILSTIRKHMLSHPVDVVVVDYIQKLRFYTDNLRREIDDALDKLSSFAKDNNIALIIVSQLRRVSSEATNSGSTEPRLNDLKESGNLENFADSVILLHRAGILDRQLAWYKIEKNRTGPTSDAIKLNYFPHSMKFEEAEPPPPEDVDDFNSTINTDEADALEKEAKEMASKVGNDGR